MVIQAHNLLTLSGIFGTSAEPVEEWSWSLKTAQFPVDTEFPEPATMADETAAVRMAWFNNLAQLHPAHVSLTRVRYSRHQEGGLTGVAPSGAYSQHDDLNVVAGTGGAMAPKPLQSAVCVSLLTPRGGPSGKGRFFLPQTTHALASDFRFSAAAAAEIANQVKAFLAAIAPAVGEVRVFSYKGFSTDVDRVRVGRVPDTMRSRRSHADEAYQQVTL